MNLLNQPSFDLLKRSADAAVLRQKVLASNIANADTPHYKRSEVQFEQLLQEKVRTGSVTGYRTHPNHLPIGHDSNQSVIPSVVTDHRTKMNNNGNNVDIDMEMALLAKNQLNYNLLVGQMGHEITMLRKAIGGSN